MTGISPAWPFFYY